MGLILATIFYALEVVDQRALRAFEAPPRMIQPETVGSAAARAAASDLMPVTQQTATGQTTRMPDSMLNTQQTVHRNAHHGRKTDGKRLARNTHSDSFVPDPGQSLMEYVMFGHRKTAGGK
jgi:hypothetical protein